MLVKKVVVSALFAAGMIGAVAIPLPSLADVEVVYVNRAPPLPIVEVVPAARQGYVWSPGYYDWKNDNHVWVQGESIQMREGYSYQPNRWVEREGRWNLERSRWDKK